MERKEAYKFTSKDAENYDFYLGGVLFEPYGKYMASRIDTTGLSNVLELACGTGRVTQYIHEALPAYVDFFATDISGDMLDIAKRRLGNDGIHYKTEDIQHLSFDDHTFDLVICQFGMMFLADRQKGFNEIARVLKPGGKLMCSTWNDALHNPLFGLLVNDLMLPYFADEDTTRLFVPFSMYDKQQLVSWARNAGFQDVIIETVGLISPPVSVEHLATGFYYKHALGKAMRDKDPLAFEAVGEEFKTELERRYGTNPSIPMSALYITGQKNITG